RQICSLPFVVLSQYPLNEIIHRERDTLRRNRLTSMLGKCAPLALLALAAPDSMHAQVTLYGALSNFDVVNDTGGEVHGFEIEFHGLTVVTSYYNGNRYGAPQVTPMPGGGGMYVLWMSPWDAAGQRFVIGTPQAVNPTPMTGHQCIIGSIG